MNDTTHGDISPATIALWATNLSDNRTKPEFWLQSVSDRMAAAAADGADLLVLPEYVSTQWLHFAQALPPSREIDWMADMAPDMLAGLAPLCERHGIALQAGTMPWRVEDADGGTHFVNRAHFITPDRTVHMHDKLCLTPNERDLEGWFLTPGGAVNIFDWNGLRTVMLVCLDVELPALAAKLAGHDVDLVLVPSMTKLKSGYNRVFKCAQARAVELMCAVAAVGCTGNFPGGEGYVAGGAVFLPCEEALGHDGLHASMPLMEDVRGAGPVLVARDIPFGALREMRAGDAEVWPGAWSADGVAIRD